MKSDPPQQLRTNPTQCKIFNLYKARETTLLHPTVLSAGKHATGNRDRCKGKARENTQLVQRQSAGKHATGNRDWCKGKAREEMQPVTATGVKAKRGKICNGIKCGKKGANTMNSPVSYKPRYEETYSCFVCLWCIVTLQMVWNSSFSGS